MDREAALFYAIAFSVGTIGSLVGIFLGWGETAVFVAGMGPVGVVMFIFMQRERHHEPPAPHAQSASRTRASRS